MANISTASIRVASIKIKKHLASLGIRSSHHPAAQLTIEHSHVSRCRRLQSLHLRDPRLLGGKARFLDPESPLTGCIKRQLDKRRTKCLICKCDVSFGSWLRDNALTQAPAVHDPVNAVRHGQSEQFFLLDDQGPPPSQLRGVLGKSGSRSAAKGLHTHALIAASNAPVPTIFMTRVRL